VNSSGHCKARLPLKDNLSALTAGLCLCIAISFALYIPENVWPDLLEMHFRVGAVQELFGVGDIEDV
jgi:hypothetical protein